MQVNRIFSAEQIQVNPELPEILKEWTKEVIRQNPLDVLDFSYQYFKEKKIQRSKLNSNELSNIRKLFDQYDNNGNGKMEIKELKSFITQDLGFDISDDDLEKVIHLLDANGSGYLEFDEIIKWWSAQC